MDGFVIKSGLKFMDRYGKWRMKPAEEAFVYDETEKDNILNLAKSEKWTVMPEFVIPARYDRESDSTAITGEQMPAYPA